jgi:dimethylaniline monooxygenase (N-oxide forming)
MDELADIIGCKPNPFDYLLNDFDLFYALMFKASVAYTYRLTGSHSWKGAREAILTLDERVTRPLMTRNSGIDLNNNHIGKNIIYFSLLVIFVGVCLLYYMK